MLTRKPSKLPETVARVIRDGKHVADIIALHDGARKRRWLPKSKRRKVKGVV